MNGLDSTLMYQSISLAFLDVGNMSRKIRLGMPISGGPRQLKKIEKLKIFFNFAIADKSFFIIASSVFLRLINSTIDRNL